MSDLTPQQRAQLDSNIKAMLSKGASQDDVIKYSNDFKLRYDPSVKKKEVGLQSGRELLTQYAPKSDNTVVQKQGQNKVEDNLSYIADKPKRVQEFKQKVLKAQETAQPEKEPFNPEEYLKQDIDTDGADVLKQISAAKKFVGEAGVDELTSGALDLKAYLGARTNQLDKKETELQNQIKSLQNKPSVGDIKANRPIDPQGIAKEETPQNEQDIYNQISAVKEKRNKLTRAADFFAKKYAFKLKPNASNRELAKLHGDLMNDPNAEQIKRLEEKGYNISESDKLNEDVTGLEIRKDALEEKYSGKEKDDNYFDELYSIEQGQKDAIHKYPELKKKLVAELVVQKLGSNGAKHLVEAASNGDEAALKMLSEKTGRPVRDLRFLETGDLPTESFLGNIFKGIYNAGSSLVTGAHRIIGDELGEDPDRIAYINKKISESGNEIFGNSPTEQTEQPQTILNEDLETVRNPKAGKYNYNLASITNLSGSAIGNLAGFVLTTKGLGALGMGERAALYSNVVLGGHEQRYERAGEVLGKGATESQKNNLAFLNGMIEAAAFEFIPKSAKEKIGMSAIDKTAEKELAQLVKAGSIQNVDKEVLKSTIQKAIEGVGKSLGEATKVTLAMKAGQLSNAIVNSVVGDEENKNVGYEEFAHGLQPAKLGEELLGLALPLSLMEIPHTARSSRQFKEVLFNSGLQPSESKAALGRLVDEGKMSEADAEKRGKVIDVMANIQKLLPETNPTTGEKLTHKQQVEYAYNRVKELAVQAKKESVKGDVALSQFYDRNAKELVDERKSIIEGTHDEYLNRSEIFDRIKDKETHKAVVNQGTKTEVVKYLSEQALTATDATNNGLKKDVELTTDLIAQNSPLEIKEQIKVLKEKLSKENDKEEKDNDKITRLDREIDMLKQGLEKTKKPEPKVEISVQPPMEVPKNIEIGGNAEVDKATENGIVVEPPQQIPEPIKLNETEKNEIPNPKEEGSTTTPTDGESIPKTEAGEGNGKEPPKGEEPVGEGDNAGITHAAIAELRKLIDLPEYEGKPKETHEQLISEAQETINNNPNAANEVLDKMENGGKVTNKDNAILAVYKAAIDAEMKKNPTKELLERATRLSKALDVSGTELGKALESRKLIAPEDNLTNFLLDSQSAQGTALSETQIKSEAAKYEELKAAKEALEKQLEIEREQHAKDIAEMGLNKAKAKARKEAKKSDTEYKQERNKSVDAAREALKKLRESGLKSTVPLIQELGAIAPHVKDFFNSLASQGIDKLDNIITQVHAEFKDVLEGITNKNILDIVSGQFDEPKTQQTRNEKANNIRLINREVQLLKELELARKGEEKAKTEKDKTSSNRRIDELKEKIKEVRRQNKNKEADNEAPEDAVAGEIEYNAKLQKKLTEKAQKLTQEIKDKKYLEEEKLPPVFKKSRKTQLLEDKVIDLENKVRHDRSKAEYEKRSKWRKGFDKVMEVLGVRRLVQSALDISVPFRQGATLLSPRKIDVWLKGFQANLQSIFSPKKFERIMHEIRNDPMYQEMVKDNIVFNDLGSADPNLHNEDFRKSFIYKIPIISEPLKASNRSADAFLNVARIEMYKKLRSNLEKRGLTRESDPKAFKFIGNWTMAMTGRGTMHSALEKPAMNAVLGNTFYGARLMASRFNLLNPVTYFDPRIPKEAKREAMKDMAAFTITMMSVGTALAYTTGAKISLNPDDGDFLQLRYGDKVYDISGGLSNYVKTGLRIVKAGYTKATKSAEEGDKATDKAGESALNFIRNKFSPNTSYAVDAFFGGRYGEEFDPSDIYRIYPMYTDDFLKAIKEEGGLMATSTVLLPNILGIGFNSYTKQDKTAYDWDKDIKESAPFKILTDNQVKLPEVPDNKKNMVIEDDTHPEGKMTEEEYKTFTEEWKKEVKKGVDELYNKGRIKTTTKIDKGGNVISESNPSKVSMSDLYKDNLEKELSSIKSEATEIAKKKAVKQSKTITTYEKRD